MSKFSFTQERTTAAPGSVQAGESNVQKMRKTLGKTPSEGLSDPVPSKGGTNSQTNSRFKTPPPPQQSARPLAPAGLKVSPAVPRNQLPKAAQPSVVRPRVSIATGAEPSRQAASVLIESSAEFSFSESGDERYAPPIDMSDPEFSREDSDAEYENVAALAQRAGAKGVASKIHPLSTTPNLGTHGAQFGQPNHQIMGIPKHAFHQEDERVPPGSHYPPWVWNACENPLETSSLTTIELYVMPAQSPATKAEPRFDARNHCLINLALQGTTVPWEGADRVLLIPVTYKRASQLGSGAAAKQSERVRDALGASQCLAQGYDQMSVLGRCTIDALGAQDDYWVIVSMKSAMAIEQRQRFTGGMQTYGLQSVTTQAGNRVGAQGVAPLQRYLGTWKGELATHALKLAHERTGPVCPQEWSKEDLDVVRAEHLTLGAASCASQSNPFAAQLSEADHEHTHEQNAGRSHAPARMRG